jgi:hypothetical protein
VQEYIRDICAEFGPLSDEQWAHVAQHSVQASEDGGYELAWDPAILSGLRIKTRDRIAFGSEFLLGFSAACRRWSSIFAAVEAHSSNLDHCSNLSSGQRNRVGALWLPTQRASLELNNAEPR